MPMTQNVRKVNPGTKTRIPNKVDGATREASASSIPLSEGEDNVQSPHPSRDQDLVVFTNFWYAAVRYQVLRGYSDNKMSEILGVSDKTIAVWRNCIDAAGVIDDLLTLIDNLPAEYRSEKVNRVRQSLTERRLALDHPAQRIGRKGTGLPSVKKFGAAIALAKGTVLQDLVMRFDAKQSQSRTPPRPSKASVELAKRIANDLVLTYMSVGDTDLGHFRDDLKRELNKLSEIAIEMSFLQANASQPTAMGVDPIYESKYEDLQEALAQQKKSARHAVRSYLAKFYRLIEAGERISESTAFIAMVSRPPELEDQDAEDPMSQASVQRYMDEHLKRLNSLVDHLARVYKRKRERAVRRAV